MGGDDNTVLVIDGAGVERWARASKIEIARRLAAKVAEALA
jgi:phosphopantothenoylcysteine decarboxylase/phosphopantothenate--cysteine ligase